jgi:hypothetical protein
MKDTVSISVKCSKCDEVYQPDLKSNRVWRCPKCQVKNPNLRRHYRSFADLCILGFIVTVIFIIAGLNEYGLSLGVLLLSAHSILLLVTIFTVYKSKAPWTDRTVKTLLWVVLGVAFLLNVVIPTLQNGRFTNPVDLIIEMVVFFYLIWLNSLAKQCTCLEAATVQAATESIEESKRGLTIPWYQHVWLSWTISLVLLYKPVSRQLGDYAGFLFVVSTAVSTIVAIIFNYRVFRQTELPKKKFIRTGLISVAAIVLSVILLAAFALLLNLTGLKEPIANLLYRAHGSSTVETSHTLDSGASLLQASQDGNVEAVKVLLAKGADVNAKADNGDTPLIMAAYNCYDNNHVEVVKLLLNKGANVNLKGWGVTTPLMAAITPNNNTEVVKVLLEKGADVHVKTETGYTPLMMAAKPALKENVDVVKLLLDKGADINAKLPDGETALSMAKKAGYSDTAQLLEKAGAKE